MKNNKKTRKEIIEKISKKTGYSQRAVEEILESYFEIISDKLIRNEKVKLQNIATLTPKLPGKKSIYNINTKKWEIANTKFNLKIKVSKKIQEKFKEESQK